MWSIAKALQVPIDTSIKEIVDIPYTISYVIRKRQQLDSFNELPKEKRPSCYLIWSAPPEELEEWLSNIYSTDKQDFIVYEDEIER